MPEIASFDLETHLIRPGRPAPTIVCGSYCTEESGTEELLTAEQVRERASQVLKMPRVTGANIAYDFGVLAADGCVTIEEIFKAYDENRVHDVLIAEALHAIAGGHLLKFPDGRDLIHPVKKTRAFRYSLELVTWLVTGRVDAKANDLFRTRYAILERLPVDEWPEEAVQYPKDDVRNAMDVALAQMGLAPKAGGQVEAHRNLHNLDAQVKAAWAMRLASMWGFRTNAKAVAELEARVEVEHQKTVQTFQQFGFIRENGKQDKSAVKRYVARAYGATKACERCGGHGKVRSPVSGNLVICKASEWSTIIDAGVERSAYGCDGTGFDIASAPSVPRSDKGGVKTDRDALMESGDEVLEEFALVSESEKLRNTYIPFLKQGTKYPINVSPNVLVATGRTSYDGLIQLIPRGGGIRECFQAREGAVLCSIDFEALELCTLAQVLIWMFGQCNMADRINATGKPGLLHTALAARMAGVSFEEMKARVAAKDKFAVGLRQASKAGGFGYPGGMGAVTLVLAKRKRSEGTTYGADGRAYPGIRFCIYMRGAERCGVEKVTQVKDRHIPPTCKACIECAEELRSAWFAENPEMRRYFNFISTDCDATGRLTQFVSERVRGGVGFSDAANCVDFDTEALTQRGWLRGDELTMEDKILTKNATTGALEWQQPQAINKYPNYAGKLHKFESQTFSAVTTPNHRWLVHDKRSGKDICVTSERLSKNGDHRIHRTGTFVGADAPYSDDVLELIGWFLTDGSMSREPGSTRVNIFQTKPPTVARISALFERLDVGAKHKTRQGGRAHVWSISDAPLHRSGKGAAKKGTGPTGVNRGFDRATYEAAGMGVDPDAVVADRLGVTLPAVGSMRRRHGIKRPTPDGRGLAVLLRTLFPDRLLTSEFVAGLSGRQAQHLMEVMLLGDGHRSKTFTKYYTRSKKAADAFQMLALLAGFASGSRWVEPSAGFKPKKYESMRNIPKPGGIWHVLVYRRDKAQVQHAQASEVTDSRGVWCPSVPNGYFVARRRNCVYVTGNSLFQGLAADGAKHALWLVSKECYTDQDSPMFGARPVLFAHDEILSEMPKIIAPWAAPRMAKVMVDAMRVYTPDIKVAAAPALMYRWSKDADAAFDASGRLIPWEDRPQKAT